jgi:GT2 family glycosyltransferase
MASFSVIVPTCHRNEALGRCLKRLQPVTANDSDWGDDPNVAVSEPNFRYEVIVTDDGTQSTAEAIVRERFPNVKWVEGPHRGPAANRNSGASAADGDWLVFSHDDCIPGIGWLDAYSAAVASHPGCAIFEGCTAPLGQKIRADQECPVNQEGGRLWSCNFAIKRSLFFELGGFDEKFPWPGFEDVDFQRRIRIANHAIEFVPGAIAYHPWRTRLGARFCIHLATSAQYFAAKYPSAKKIFSETWGIKRIAKIFVFEFPRNLLSYGEGSFRTLYLDLLTAFHVSLILMRRSAPTTINGAVSQRNRSSSAMMSGSERE